mgnify:CR=1 FL=1
MGSWDGIGLDGLDRLYDTTGQDLYESNIMIIELDLDTCCVIRSMSKEKRTNIRMSILKKGLCQVKVAVWRE